jgi:hypothetical protein
MQNTNLVLYSSHCLSVGSSLVTILFYVFRFSTYHRNKDRPESATWNYSFNPCLPFNEPFNINSQSNIFGEKCLYVAVSTKICYYYCVMLLSPILYSVVTWCHFPSYNNGRGCNSGDKIFNIRKNQYSMIEVLSKISSILYFIIKYIL